MQDCSQCLLFRFHRTLEYLYMTLNHDYFCTSAKCTFHAHVILTNAVHLSKYMVQSFIYRKDQHLCTAVYGLLTKVDVVPHCWFLSSLVTPSKVSTGVDFLSLMDSIPANMYHNQENKYRQENKRVHLCREMQSTLSSSYQMAWLPFP